MKSYSEFKKPLGLYDNETINSNIQLKEDDNDITIDKILSFSMETKLWNSISNEKWKKSGLDDVRLENRNNLKSNIHFGILEEGVRGRTYFDEFGATEIILNETYKKSLNVTSFSQILIMELGNVKNSKLLKKITPKKYKKEEYVRAIEKLEFQIRIQIIESYLKGDFYSEKYQVQECVFDTSVLDFETYFKSEKLRKHREYYEREWEDYHNE